MSATHKLARLIYTLPTKGQDYFEERYRQRVLRQLTLRAEKFGMKLVADERLA